MSCELLTSVADHRCSCLTRCLFPPVLVPCLVLARVDASVMDYLGSWVTAVISDKDGVQGNTMCDRRGQRRGCAVEGLGNASSQ
jgi:hypothetical protein